MYDIEVLRPESDALLGRFIRDCLVFIQKLEFKDTLEFLVKQRNSNMARFRVGHVIDKNFVIDNC